MRKPGELHVGHFFLSFFVGHHVGHHVGHLVGHLVHLHVGYHDVVSTLCEISGTLTEWKSESVMDDRQRTDGQTDGRTRVLATLVCLKILDYGGMLLIYI